ncbi:MAG: glutaminase A [Caldilinea sp.]
MKTFISTGTLPPPERVQALIDQAHREFKDNDEGRNASHYPALSEVPRDLFAICLTDVQGNRYEAGVADYPFSIMSVCKPFAFALVSQALGLSEVRAKIGVNATGLPFNSVTAIEQNASHLTNPMVNSGAIATVSLAPGATAEEKWRFLYEGLCRFTGRELTVNQEIFTSASASNHRNRAIARILFDYNCLYFDPIETTDLYTKLCSLNVTVRDLAVMAATLADGGYNPVTHERVVDAGQCAPALAVMATAGMYENSGEWLLDIGLPGKSGVSGGIITVSPGKGGLATFAPPLDTAGNSVRGQLAIRYLAKAAGLGLFASKPAI